MEKTPAISIIIPVYNRQKYLNQCIDSVLDQTFEDFEVIIIDDGSTDNSINIIKDYAKKDNRIKYFLQKRQYAGVARNNGIKKSQGEYILFLDSDDFLEPDALYKLYEKTKQEDSDITVCLVNEYDDRTGTTKKIDWSFKKELLQGATVFSYKDFSEIFFFLFVGWAWDRLYKSSLIKNNNFEFENLKSCESAAFVFLTAVTASKITYVDEYLMNYRIHYDSLNYNREPYSIFLSFLNIKKQLERMGKFEALEKTFINKTIEVAHIHFAITKNLSSKIAIFYYIKNKFFDVFNLDKYNDDFITEKTRYKELKLIKQCPLLLYPFKNLVKKIQIMINCLT